MSKLTTQQTLDDHSVLSIPGRPKTVLRSVQAKTPCPPPDSPIDDLRQRLYQKAHGLLQAGSKEELVGELADVYEIFGKLRKTLFMTVGDLKQISANKRPARGKEQQGS